MANPGVETGPAPIPFFEPRFWLLVANTIRMKRRHRRTLDRVYTDHLTEFYTRSKTRHVEAYGDAYSKVRKLVVSLADPQGGERVVDLATGGGYQAAAFAAAGFPTVGMDYVPDRARLAREKHGCNGLAWGSGDIARLPFKDKSIDVVTITFALHDLPLDTQMEGLRECCRVARRRVVIAEPRPPGNRIKRFLYEFIGELLDESLHFKEFLQRDFEAQLAETGLVVCSLERRYGDLVTVYVCEPTFAL